MENLIPPNNYFKQYMVHVRLAHQVWSQDFLLREYDSALATLLSSHHPHKQLHKTIIGRPAKVYKFFKRDEWE